MILLIPRRRTGHPRQEGVNPPALGWSAATDALEPPPPYATDSPTIFEP